MYLSAPSFFDRSDGPLIPILAVWLLIGIVGFLAALVTLRIAMRRARNRAAAGGLPAYVQQASVTELATTELSATELASGLTTEPALA